MNGFNKAVLQRNKYSMYISDEIQLSRKLGYIFSTYSAITTISSVPNSKPNW